MARTLTAFLQPNRVPDRVALQRAIDALGRALALDAGDDPFATAGYRPCTLQGEDASAARQRRRMPACLVHPDVARSVQAGKAADHGFARLGWFWSATCLSLVHFSGSGGL